MLGAVHKWRHAAKGGVGVIQIMTYHDKGGEGGKSKYDEDMGGTANSKNDIDFGGRGMIKNDQNTFLIYVHKI